MQLTISQRIAAGFAMPVVALALIGGVSYRSTAGLIEAVDWRTHTMEVLQKLGEVDLGLSDAQRSVRGYLITEKDNYLDPYRQAVKTLPQSVDRVAALTDDNPRQRTRTAELKPLVREVLDEMGKIIELQEKKGNQAAIDQVRTNRDKETMDQVRKLIDTMQDEERQLLRTREAEAQNASRNAQITITGGSAAAGLVILLAGFFLSRSVTRPVRTAVKELATISEELSAGTSEQAAGAQEQAAAVAETVTTVDEVTQTSDQAAQRARAVGEAIQRTNEVGKSGRQTVEQSIAALGAVQEQVASTAENILALAEQAQAIGEIIAAVNDIAEQTNMLALNAAIEASRAGEYGRGFAVVASEIRALADQSKRATGQVRQILGEIQKATNTAVLSTEDVTKGVAGATKVSDLAGGTIRTLTETLGEASQATAQIGASASQQALGMTQILQAMRNIEEVAQHNLTAVRRTEAAAQTLKTLSGNLARLVSG